MSFYDDASLVFLPSGGAGKDGKAYSIKPVPEYGSELVTNGGFNTDSDWIKGTGWTISGGTANCDGTQSSTSQLRTSVGLSIQNTLVRFSFEVKNYSAGTLIATIEGTGGNEFSGINSDGIYTVEATSTDSTPRIAFNADSSFVGSIDNVSVREVIVGDGDFTFSRGSNLTATRVDSNGLIEKGRENLLTYSNDFSNTWINVGSTEASGQSGYDGSNDAWELTKVGNAEGYIKYESHSVSGVNTISIYAKESSSSWIYIFADTIGGYYFDLRPSTTGNRVGTQVLPNTIDGSAFVEDIGNDWFRVGFSWNGSNSRIRITPAEGDGQRTDTSGSIYIQDAQLEQGLVATEYIESGASTGKAGILEDSPRFDYSGGASCPSLLLEPSRTNSYIYHSEYITSSLANISREISNVDSPIKDTPFLKITKTGTGISRFSFTSFSTNGDFDTCSVFAKAGSSNILLFADSYNGTSTINAKFNLTNGDWDETPSGSALYDYGFEDFGNGMYRVWVCGQTYNTDTPEITARWRTPAVYCDIDQLPLGKYIYITGMQTEKNAKYPTSYIPNHSGGSVTRGADGIRKTGLSSVIGQTEGTIFIDFLYESNQSGNRFSISDGTANNWIFIGTPESGTSSRFYIRVNNSVIVDVGASSYFVDGTRYKLALAYKSGDWAVYGNGTQLYIGTDNIPSFSSPIDTINFKSYFASDSVTEKEKINQVLVFGTALSTTDLEILTGATSYESFSAMATALNYTTYE